MTTRATQPEPMTTCTSCNGPVTYRGFYTASVAYYCHNCCFKNQHAFGFYGPPGTRSLQDAGGRNCVRCGTDHTSDQWRPSKRVHGRYVCNSCRAPELRELEREGQDGQVAAGGVRATGSLRAGRRRGTEKSGGADNENEVTLSAAAAAAAMAASKGAAPEAAAAAPPPSPSGGGGFGHGGERLRRAAAIAAEGGISRCLARMALGVEAGAHGVGAGARMSEAHRDRVKPESQEEEMEAGETVGARAAKKRRVAREGEATVRAARRDAGGQSRRAGDGGRAGEDKDAGGVRKGAGGKLVPPTPSSTGGATSSGGNNTSSGGGGGSSGAEGGSSSSSRSSDDSSDGSSSSSSSEEEEATRPGEGGRRCGGRVGRWPAEQRRGGSAAQARRRLSAGRAAGGAKPGVAEGRGDGGLAAAAATATAPAGGVDYFRGDGDGAAAAGAATPAVQAEPAGTLRGGAGGLHGAGGGPGHVVGTTRTCVHCGQAVDLVAGVRGFFHTDHRFVCHWCAHAIG